MQDKPTYRVFENEYDHPLDAIEEAYRLRDDKRPYEITIYVDGAPAAVVKHAKGKPTMFDARTDSHAVHTLAGAWVYQELKDHPLVSLEHLGLFMSIAGDYIRHRFEKVDPDTAIAIAKHNAQSIEQAWIEDDIQNDGNLAISHLFEWAADAPRLKEVLDPRLRFVKPESLDELVLVLKSAYEARLKTLVERCGEALLYRCLIRGSAYTPPRFGDEDDERFGESDWDYYDAVRPEDDLVEIFGFRTEAAMPWSEYEERWLEESDFGRAPLPVEDIDGDEIPF